MRAHVVDPPPDLKALEPDIPHRFRALVDKMVAKSAEDRHPSMEEVLTELESISGRRRTQWNGMLRTPRTGAMTARGTLVIDLQRTIVQRVGLLERVSPTVRNLLRRLPGPRQVGRLLSNVTRLRRLLPGLGGLALPRPSNWPGWLPTLPALPRPLPPELWGVLRRWVPGAGAIRLALVFCSSAVVAGTLLLAGRALVASGGVTQGSVVPAKPAPPTAERGPNRARPPIAPRIAATPSDSIGTVTPQAEGLPLRVPPPVPRRQARSPGERTGPALVPASRYRPVDD